MRITILTLFPEMFHGPFDHSILKRAKEKQLLSIDYVNIRDFGLGRHKVVDDTPYGGGIGMVCRVDVLYEAIESVRDKTLKNDEEKVILTSAGGKTYSQTAAKAYSTLKHLIIICGHYEGVDERVTQYVDDTVSIGNYVLTGGEIPAMVVTDSISRLVSGVITDGATENESFSLKSDDQPLLEYPHYTKPNIFRGKEVPSVLLSGDHKKIEEWRMSKAKEKTAAQPR